MKPATPERVQERERRALAAGWYRRWSALRARFALVVLAVAGLVSAVAWLGGRALTVDAGSGTPVGLSVRTDAHVATLIQTLEPYVPSPSRDHSKDRYRLGIHLVRLDGTEAPVLVPILEGRSSAELALARILGSDGRTLWFDAGGLGGVDLRDGTLVTNETLREANPKIDPGWWEDTRGVDVDGRLRVTSRDRARTLEVDPETRRATEATGTPRSTRSPFPPTPSSNLGAGLLVDATHWLGLHSESEVERDFRPGSRLRRVVRADDAREARGFYAGLVEADGGDAPARMVSMTPLSDGTYLNGAFLRVDDRSEPMRLSDPDGALVVFTSAPGLAGTLVVARVDTTARLLWRVDTGVDRFTLRQILPGERSTAFVGTRPPVPDRVSEPLLVIVDHATGEAATHSLWR